MSARKCQRSPPLKSKTRGASGLEALSALRFNDIPKESESPMAMSSPQGNERDRWRLRVHKSPEAPACKCFRRDIFPARNAE
jgi:hypothetical protein